MSPTGDLLVTVFHGEELAWSCSGLLDCGTGMAQSRSLHTQLCDMSCTVMTKNYRGRCCVWRVESLRP
eukprot:4591939-Amphidinium_carterae.1